MNDDEIENELNAAVADANIEAARTWRLSSIGALAVLLVVAFVTSDEMSADDLLRLLAMFAGACALFHFATWLLLKVLASRAQSRN